jgi:hypothetical protein
LEPPVTAAGNRRRLNHNIKKIKTMKTIFLATAMGCVALAGRLAHAATITWTNTVSGGWNTAANWNPNQVPGATDTAIITNAGVTVTLDISPTVGGIILGTNGAGTVTLSLNSQTLTLNGPLAVNPSGSFTVDSGTLAGNSNAVLSGTIGWIAGVLEGILTLAPGSTLNINNSANNHTLQGCTFTNNGTVAWASGTIQGGHGTAIYNYGLWDAQSDQQLNNNLGGGTTFNNYGTFLKSAGTEPNSTSFQSGVGFVNDGTVDAQNGLMVFSGNFANAASTLAVENGATIQIAQAVVLPGGLVTGSGTVQAPSITSSAVVSPGATNAVLNLAGNYTQLLGGSIQFDIGGTSPGVNQSQVNVTGTANLNGLIALRFSPGYVPAVNSSNLVLTAASRTGHFPFQDHFYLLGQNKRINAVYSPTNVVLATISAADPTNVSLSAAVQGQTFALAWPSEFGSYDLEVKTNLDDLNWTFVPGVTNFYSETPMTSPHKFFRLEVE